MGAHNGYPPATDGPDGPLLVDVTPDGPVGPELGGLPIVDGPALVLELLLDGAFGFVLYGSPAAGTTDNAAGFFNSKPTTKPQPSDVASGADASLSNASNVKTRHVLVNRDGLGNPLPFVKL